MDDRELLREVGAALVALHAAPGIAFTGRKTRQIERAVARFSAWENPERGNHVSQPLSANA